MVIYALHLQTVLKTGHVCLEYSSNCNYVGDSLYFKELTAVTVEVFLMFQKLAY